MTGLTKYRSGHLTLGRLRMLFYSYLLKGQKVRCNLCGHNFKRFMVLRPQQRPNALCPVCGSVESTRALWFYLSNEVLGKKNKRNFLYFSPEKPILEKLKKQAIELLTENRDYFRSVAQADFTGRLKGGYFDVILFSHQLQYLADDGAALEELHRLLRTGGFVLILSVVNPQMDRTYENPTSDEDRDRLHHFYDPGIFRVYGANFKKQLARSGFKVEMINYPEELGQQAQNYYQLGDGSREVIYKCKKPDKGNNHKIKNKSDEYH